MPGTEAFDSPELLDLPAFKVARIPLTIPAAEVRSAMGAGLGELRRVLADQGVELIGPWLTHHLKAPGQIFDFEVCFPVLANVKPEGRVSMGEIHAARTARITHQGSYDQLSKSWSHLMNWINSQSLTPAPDLWEAYVTGPDTSSKPEDWRTQLNRPLL